MLQFWLHAFGSFTDRFIKNIKRSVKDPLVELTWLHRKMLFPVVDYFIYSI